MNIVQQINDKAYAIYQVVEVYSIYQSLKRLNYQVVHNKSDHETKLPDYLHVVIRIDHQDHL